MTTSTTITTPTTTAPTATSTPTAGRLRQRMAEDMAARKLGPHSQRSHIESCKRFAAFRHAR